ncbi:MAG: peroxiredoxin [Planctomycetota bacterium]|jgi:alkyl hydroperoxide reductase subunit AhpC
MGLLLGDIAPDFTANTTEGPIRFHDWLGDSWGIIFSHPRDFTPVCTTELGAVARLKDEFDRRRVKVIGLSIDDVETHSRWIDDINRTQRTVVQFPIIADPDRQIADLYGMLYGMISPGSAENPTVRSVFVIGPDKMIRLMLAYPANTGRNFDEILRVIDALQISESHEVSTPANWKPGDDCLIPQHIEPQEIPSRYPQGYMEITPYLRYTPQPNSRPTSAPST